MKKVTLILTAILLIGLGIIILIYIKIFPVMETSRYIPLSINICKFFEEKNRFPIDTKELEKWNRQTSNKNYAYLYKSITFRQNVSVDNFANNNENLVEILDQPKPSAVINDIIRSFVRGRLEVEKRSKK